MSSNFTVNVSTLLFHKDTVCSSFVFNMCFFIGSKNSLTCSSKTDKMTAITITGNWCIVQNLHIIKIKYFPKMKKNSRTKINAHWNKQAKSRDSLLLPSTYSMTIITGCRWAAIPMNLTMFGWSYCFRMRPSWRNFFLWSSDSVSLHVFTATTIPFGLYLPRYTSPKLPYVLKNRICLLSLNFITSTTISYPCTPHLYYPSLKKNPAIARYICNCVYFKNRSSIYLPYVK